MHSELIQTSKEEPSAKIAKAESRELLSQKVPSEMPDWVLNMSM